MRGARRPRCSRSTPRRRPGSSTWPSTSSAPHVADRPTSSRSASATPRRCSPPSRSAATTSVPAPRPGSPARAARPGRSRSTSPAATQMHDFRTIQEHDAPHTTSDLLFKGAVQDHAAQRLHRPDQDPQDAKGTDGVPDEPQPHAQRGRMGRERAQPRHRDQRRQVQPRLAPSARSTRTALLPREPRHTPEVAERLVVLGFFDEVIAQLPVGSLAAELRLRISKKLHKAVVPGDSNT